VALNVRYVCARVCLGTWAHMCKYVYVYRGRGVIRSFWLLRGAPGRREEGERRTAAAELNRIMPVIALVHPGVFFSVSGAGVAMALFNLSSRILSLLSTSDEVLLAAAAIWAAKVFALSSIALLAASPLWNRGKSDPGCQRSNTQPELAMVREAKEHRPDTWVGDEVC